VGVRGVWDRDRFARAPKEKKKKEEKKKMDGMVGAATPLSPSLSLSLSLHFNPHLRRQDHGHVVPAVKQGQRPREKLGGGDLVRVKDAHQLIARDGHAVGVELAAHIV
jgi:hypothetical protein